MGGRRENKSRKKEKKKEKKKEEKRKKEKKEEGEISIKKIREQARSAKNKRNANMHRKADL